MNDTKFTTFCQCQGPISSETYLKIVSHFFRDRLGGSPSATSTEAIHFMRWVGFCCGSNIRRIHQFSLEDSQLRLPPFHHDELRREASFRRSSKIIDALNTALWKENYVLFQPFHDCVKEDWLEVDSMSDKICSTEWQTCMKGLSFDTVRQLCKENGSTLEEVVHLADKSWFGYSQDKIFPTSPVALFCQFLVTADYNSSGKRAGDLMFKSLQTFVQVAFPPVVAALQKRLLGV